MTISEIEKQIESEFQYFDDWMDKYNYLIEMGKSLPLIDPENKTLGNIISGCQSRVWLHASYENGLVKFTSDADAVISKGMTSLLIRVLSNQTPDDIINAKLEFIDKIGLKEHLSPTRSNGLVSTIKQMKLYALAIKTKFEAGEME